MSTKDELNAAAELLEGHVAAHEQDKAEFPEITSHMHERESECRVYKLAATVLREQAAACEGFEAWKDPLSAHRHTWSKRCFLAGAAWQREKGEGK